jgi:hypothetical protein
MRQVEVASSTLHEEDMLRHLLTCTVPVIAFLYLAACAGSNYPTVSHAPTTATDSVRVTWVILYSLARDVGTVSGETGELPISLDPIIRRRPHTVVWERYLTGVDVWGQTIRYTPSEQAFELRSAGPDRILETEDDIVATGRLARDRPCSVRDEHRTRVVDPPCDNSPE